MAPEADAAEQAYVVGGSGAIGSVVVGRLLAEGLDVVAVGRSEAALQRLATRHPAAGLLVADLARDEAVAAIAARAAGRTVRMVVHAPGLAVSGGISDVPAAALAEAVNVKAGGMLRLVRGVDSRLCRGARLVAIGGHYGFEPNAYAACAGVANAALVNLVRQLNLVYGGRGVTAHTVAPGPADTPRLHDIAAARARQRGGDLAAVLAEMAQDSPLQAFTTPEQVAWAITMLLAPEADALAGSTLMMDAGRRRGLP